MADADYLDDDAIAVDRVDDAIGSLAHAAKLLVAGELLAAGRTRIVARCFDASEDASDIRLRDAEQVLRYRSLEAQLISRDRPSACEEFLVAQRPFPGA